MLKINFINIFLNINKILQFLKLIFERKPIQKIHTFYKEHPNVSLADQNHPTFSLERKSPLTYKVNVPLSVPYSMKLTLRPYLLNTDFANDESIPSR